MAIDPAFERYSSLNESTERFKSSKEFAIQRTQNAPMKDTIEFSHEKLKEEALSRIGKKETYVIFQDTFIKIGKYLFLGIALPPYIAVVALPKWIVVEVLPAIILMVQQCGNRISQPLKKTITFIASKIQQLVLFTQQIGNYLIQPIIKLFLEARKGFRSMKDQALLYLTKVNNSVQSFLKKPKEALLEKIERFFAPLSTIKFAWEKKRAALQSQLKEVPSLLKHIILSKINELKDLQLSLRELVCLRLESTVERAVETTRVIFEKVERKFNHLKIFFSPLRTFYLSSIQPHLQFFSDLLKRNLKKGGEFLDRMNSKIQFNFAQLQEKLRKGNSDQMIHRFFSHRAFLALPSEWQLMLKKCLTHWIFMAIFEKCVSFVKWFLIQSIRGIAYFISMSEKGMQSVLRFSISLLETLSLVLKKMKVKFSIFCSHAFRLIKMGTYYVLLTLMIISILLERGFHLLQALTNGWMTRLSFKSKNSG